jgi:hypothetical protein
LNRIKIQDSAPAWAIIENKMLKLTAILIIPGDGCISQYASDLYGREKQRQFGVKYISSKVPKKIVTGYSKMIFHKLQLSQNEYV